MSTHAAARGVSLCVCRSRGSPLWHLPVHERLCVAVDGRVHGWGVCAGGRRECVPPCGTCQYMEGLADARSGL
eukprot:365842-Chlamydomonas_euryale.AAC.4